MKNIRMSAAAWGLVLLVAVGLPQCGSSEEGKARKEGQASATGPAASGAEAPAPPLELELAVNQAYQASIAPGDPLVFDLYLRNAAALEAGSREVARQRLEEELAARVREQKLTKAEAEARLKAEPAPPPAPPLSLTLKEEQFSFQRREEKGPAPLPWKPRLVAPPAAAVTLGEEKDAILVFVVPPEATAATPEGDYRVAAGFENRVPGQWQGKVSSNEVAITVKREAADQADQLRRLMSQVEYFLAVKDFPRAEEMVNRLLTLKPNFIDGLELRGRVQEAQGDLPAALASYCQALGEYQRRFPQAEPAWELMRKVRRLEGKLRPSPPPKE